MNLGRILLSRPQFLSVILVGGLIVGRRAGDRGTSRMLGHALMGPGGVALCADGSASGGADRSAEAFSGAGEEQRSRGAKRHTAAKRR